MITFEAQILEAQELIYGLDFCSALLAGRLSVFTLDRIIVQNSTHSTFMDNLGDLTVFYTKLRYFRI